MNMLHRQKDTAELPIAVNTKLIYKQLVVRFIEKIQALEEEYLSSDGLIYLLFDNPTSRFDLQKSFYYAQRKQIYSKYKEQRAREAKEFYNSLDLIRYYYLTNKKKYVSIQVKNVEADDLVKPVLDNYCKGLSVLMVTNDYDWTRYLSSDVDWLPDYYQPPQTTQDFINKKGFFPTEQSVIAYKSIFGDPADNIPHLSTENVNTLFEFVELYKSNARMPPENLITMSCNSALVEKYKILKAIRDNDRQYRINIQLTSTIPIGVEHLKAVTCYGREAKIITESVEVVLGMKKRTKEFVFGNVKYTR